MRQRDRERACTFDALVGTTKMETLITNTVESPDSVETFLMTVRYLYFTFILIYNQVLLFMCMYNVVKITMIHMLIPNFVQTQT